MYSEQDLFEYDALNDEEIEKLQAILAPGQYKFEVIKAEKAISSANNPMIVLSLKVWDHEGNVHNIRDWLTSSPKMIFKVKHFWESVGEPDRYKGKNYVQDFVGKCGDVAINNGKDKKGILRAQVQDYSLPAVSAKPIKADEFKDDDIPF
jgi:hypothetical protein